MRLGGLAAPLAMALALLTAGGPGLCVLVHAFEAESEHVCSCSLSAGHHCRCPHCSREAHEKFLEDLEDGRPRLTSHDCSDEAGARPSRLPRATAVEPPAELALTSVTETRVFADPALLLSRLLPPPPSPPPIG